MEGFSGSVLCLGQMHAKTCQAICFQNSQTPLYSNELVRHDYRGSPPDTTSYPTVKGGFLFPNEVRESEIFSEDPGPKTAPGTFQAVGEIQKVTKAMRTQHHTFQVLIPAAYGARRGQHRSPWNPKTGMRCWTDSLF